MLNSLNSGYLFSVSEFKRGLMFIFFSGCFLILFFYIRVDNFYFKAKVFCFGDTIMVLSKELFYDFKDTIFVFYES